MARRITVILSWVVAAYGLWFAGFYLSVHLAFRRYGMALFSYIAPETMEYAFFSGFLILGPLVVVLGMRNRLPGLGPFSPPRGFPVSVEENQD